MARDWIKMRTDLLRDPKVSTMADSLLPASDTTRADTAPRYELRDVTRDVTCYEHSVTRAIVRNAVVGALSSVWGVLRHQGRRVDDDLIVNGASLSAIDDIANLPCFGAAMRAAGWVVERDGGLVLPCFFEENNADPGERPRSKGAERQARYRERKSRNGDDNSDVTGDVPVTPRERVRERDSIFSSADADAAGGDGKGGAVQSQRRVIPGREIVDAYHELLPMLPQVRQLTDKRKQWLKARWMEDAERQTVQWWRGFFGYVAESDFLTGRNGQWTGCSFEWLINSSNFVKVIEGNYENKGGE